MLTRPEITEEILHQINQVIAENPGWGRTRISKYLCEVWGWRIPGGSYKDISCRDMLRALDKAGKITLPASIKMPQVNGKREILHLNHDMTPVETNLSKLRPLEIETIEKGMKITEYLSLIDTYHYLGYDRTVGENMKYVVRSQNGTILACLLFGSAAWACRDRDSFLGWDELRRKQNLQLITNNTRFLILPWVRAPHLASHILSIVARRIADDWQKKYGHKVYCLETFVECDRFAGTCYKAANWIYVGQTTGRGRDDIMHAKSPLPIKDIYLYPLSKNSRRILKSDLGGEHACK
jgi:hypothetical protein